MRLGCRCKALLEVTVARTEDGDLAAARYNLRQTIEKKVETLLRREPADRAEQRRILALLEPESASQRRLCRALAGRRILGPIDLRQERIVPRIPDARIDAVQNSGQCVGTAA